MRIKLEKKTMYPKLGLRDEIENKSFFFIKGPRTTIRNQKDKDQSENPHKLDNNSEIIHGYCEF